MSFEQLETQDQERKKKKKLEDQKNEQFFLEKKIREESTELLQKLASQLASEFWIDITQAKQLISGSTEEALWKLASWVSHLSLSQNEKLQQAIWEAKNSLKNISKQTRESLKQSLEQEKLFEEEQAYMFTKNIFPSSFLERGKNPKNIQDQCIGGVLWILDTTEAVILFLYGLSRWVLLTPYHIYLLITGKAHYEGWHKI